MTTEPRTDNVTELRWAKTACILCECNCGLEVAVTGRTLSKIRGDKDHPTSAGYTCEKPLRLDRYQNRRDRLTSPLRRRPDGSFEEIDWDTAIREIAAKLTAIKTEHGGDKIFFYGGGGQGNHLGRVYGQSLQAAVGAKYYSNALAQEKTGEMWVDGKLYGGHTKGDFEHSEVVVFVGKNPWQSHSFPRARPALKQIAADPGRSMIVLDPRRSETADLADFHLQVRPGTDAWCLAALLGVLVQDDLVDHDFLAAHTTGADPVLAALADIPVSEYAERCGVPADLIRRAAHRIGTAASVTTYEDLGTQQGPHSTLVSYLNKLVWILTGNFARPGTMFLHSSFAPLAGVFAGDRDRRSPGPLDVALQRVVTEATRLGAKAAANLVPALARIPGIGGVREPAAKRLLDLTAPLAGPLMSQVNPFGGGRTSPVTGARIIGGMIPCNSITEEILTDHPNRFRAIWLDAVNPAHSLADSGRWREALDALDLVVVIDVALTETAQQADYVLPASSQFEKWEVSFFNFEFPENAIQLRAPALDPTPGTLPEAEIYARLIRELDVVDHGLLTRLRAAARAGRDSFALTFFAATAADPALLKLATYVLYETLGPTLPDGARATAGLWALAHMCALGNPDAVRRAGFTGPGFTPGDRLFDAVLANRSGVTFTVDEWPDVWHYVRRKDGRITVEIPELLDHLRGIADDPGVWTTAEFPLVLSAGERRSFTANTIIRDPSWRRRDPDGALRISPADADRFGLTDGGPARLVTERAAVDVVLEVTDMMRPGHISLPNGYGLSYPDADGNPVRTGVAPNELTSLHHRDWLAGTPWHKHVPARLEPLDAP